MHQPSERDRHAAADGAAHDDQARVVATDAEQLRFLRGRRARLDRILRLPQRRHLEQVVRRRRAREVDPQVVGRTRRIDVAVFALQRHAVFVVHDAGVKDRRAGFEPKLQRECLGRGFLAREMHLGVVPVAALGDLFVQIADRQVDETRCSGAANVPAPCMRSIRPSDCSSRSARLTVMRLTPNFATSSDSDGISAPGGQRPRASAFFR